ncbi:MAG: HAMP domain-containing sensor histidine kinase [Gammaproteobacteria bacterium]|nr:HAMP domain-containing sensor histidine kinase [Gammaproteobacteria bacterium]
MTGSYQENSVTGRPGTGTRRGAGRAAGGHGRSGRLLYLREEGATPKRQGFDSAGGVLTLLGVAAGLAVGYVLYTLGVVKPGAPVHYVAIWLMAVPALMGGGIGVVAAWLQARTKLAQALVTSEGFRQRLMSIERNQALWISLSAVLHDVRNPLHNINLLVESLAVPGSDVERIRAQISEQLERIYARVRRVTSQIAELSGDIERRPVDLDRVLKEVHHMIKPLARQARASIRMPDGANVRVVADSKFLVQAIDHLMLNSLQILSDQPVGRPRMLTVSHHCEALFVEMWVDDSGPGLPDEVRQRLFEPLTVSRANGMGLGLAIAHALASAAGAELTLGRTGADGTRFVLRIPCDG